MGRYVLGFDEISGTQTPLVGGKGAGLGELCRIEGVTVPAGFCVTTEAFKRILADVPAIDDWLDSLSRLKPDDREGARAVGAQIRRALEAVVLPDDMADSIEQAIESLGARTTYAVRSSATAEDLPTASFAGQHDSYLNVVGDAAVLEAIKKCWASLYTERAVSYRVKFGLDHRQIQMAVVVQRMLSPSVSGVLFTAEPINGNRKISVVEASFGLGEALVSGVVSPDVYQVKGEEVFATRIGSKQVEIRALTEGGTEESVVDAEKQNQPALTERQVLGIVELGRRIEAHFGIPQDIEWCLDDGKFQIVQSRPITTLFPIPAAGDTENRVYVSVGHNQMMTDAMKPLGLSIWQMSTMRPMAESGWRLFVDVTAALAAPTSRAGLLGVMGRGDPLIRDALQSVLDRADFIRTVPDPASGAGAFNPALSGGAGDSIAADPSLVTDLIAASEASVAVLAREIQEKSGAALLDFILADSQELKRVLFAPKSMQVIMAGMEAFWWLNDNLLLWLGERNAADILTQSVPNNITSAMGLGLLDVADAIRPHPDVVAFLEHVDNDDFLNQLVAINGGAESRDAIVGWLDKYGMRGVGEIDITRPRWSERPAMLLPLILGNIKNFESGAATRRFELGEQAASQKERQLLEQLRALPDGETKAAETRRMIERVRVFAGYREYPKFGKVSREFFYKRALMGEAERLVGRGVLREKEDIFYLRFDELREVVRTGQVDGELIARRKDEFKRYEALRPPRILTSDGECISGSYHRDDFPAGALVGLGVSAGLTEGRARVILDISKADLEPGDILVTAYTDPSWTPLFVAITALVTEVGGLMTHGAVIAREYGLPAVVGVANATQVIRDGQRIRVHGAEGYVELL